MDRTHKDDAGSLAPGREGAGTLYVVGTPIGNLQDLSPRAREILGRADVVAAEDTRRTRILLSSIGVETPLIAFHEHNEQEQAGRLLRLLDEGQSVALVSDAGMPLVSDPGFKLVRSAHEGGFAVQVVPGPCAVTAALCASGLPTDRFTFEGFLPRKAAAQAARLEALVREPRTMVFFESVHRLRETLAALAASFGPQRPAALARELTKVHEQVFTGTLGDVAEAVGTEIPELGEIVIVVAGAAAAPAEEAEAARVFGVLSKALPPGEAVALTAELTGLPRNRVYRLTRVR